MIMHLKVNTCSSTWFSLGMYVYVYIHIYHLFFRIARVLLTFPLLHLTPPLPVQTPGPKNLTLIRCHVHWSTCYTRKKNRRRKKVYEKCKVQPEPDFLQLWTTGCRESEGAICCRHALAKRKECPSDPQEKCRGVHSSCKLFTTD